MSPATVNDVGTTNRGGAQMKVYNVLLGFGFQPTDPDQPVRHVVPGDTITSEELSDERAAVMIAQGCIELVP